MKRAMTKECARKLIRYVVLHMERESLLLFPSPNIVMRHPYGLLDLIRDESPLSTEEIDTVMVEAQRKGKA